MIGVKQVTLTYPLTSNVSGFDIPGYCFLTASEQLCDLLFSKELYLHYTMLGHDCGCEIVIDS